MQSNREGEYPPRCTRYAFQWAGYQRRIHPTFHAGMHFCSFFLSLTLRTLRLVHTCGTRIEKSMDRERRDRSMTPVLIGPNERERALDGNKSPILSRLRLRSYLAVNVVPLWISLRSNNSANRAVYVKHTTKKKEEEFHWKLRFQWNLKEEILSELSIEH